MDIIVPGGWFGDLFKAYLLSRDSTVDGGRAAASIVVKNVVEIVLVLGTMIFSLVSLVLFYHNLDPVILFSVGTAMILLTVPLVFVVYLTVKPSATKKIFRWLSRGLSSARRKRWSPDDFQSKAEKTITEYNQGMKTLLAKPKGLVQPVMWLLLAYGSEMLALFLIFASLGSVVSFDKVIIVHSIAGNLESQGSAFMGFASIVSTALFTSLGITPRVSFSAVLLAGFAIFGLRLLISYIAFQCVVLSRCISFFCRSCGLEKKSCPEDAAKKKK